MKTAIVLAGGGAKGAYEIGVWKALNKLHIHYDIVTGTSVGALNGAFMVEKDLKNAEWMWENINFNMIFSDFDINYNTKDGKKKMIQKYAEGILFQGGMDVTELERTIKKYIQIDKFYQSPIDYGLITVDFSNLKPMEMRKLDIPKDQLCDYLMASATCFPAFKKKKIGDSEFIDGGYYDNLPINLAIKMGARRVIAVNIGTMGITKPILDKDVEVIMIEPRTSTFGSFLVFDASISKRLLTLGYNDTMKTFGKYDGNVFTFKHREIKKITKKYYNKLCDELKKWLPSDKILKKMSEAGVYYDFLSTKERNLKEQLMLEMIENLGTMFGFEETVVYDMKLYHDKLKKIKKTLEIEQQFSLEWSVLVEKLKQFSHSKLVVGYLYRCLNNIEDKKDEKRLSSLALLFEEEFIEALYLSLLK